jgi:hypothetical protein
MMVGSVIAGDYRPRIQLEPLSFEGAQADRSVKHYESFARATGGGLDGGFPLNHDTTVVSRHGFQLYIPYRIIHNELPQ